ncbi:MAG: YdeI/OmpD-associated family protein [Solirubrobacteraceae bacterium]|nr:YdeI/OmpD-associated family protein [Patulibacter sp.]
MSDPGTPAPDAAKDPEAAKAARAAATEARRRAAVAEATFFDDPAAFRDWLEEHAERSKGLWIRFAKVGSGIEGGTYAQALDEALCFGWIDGAKFKDDDERFWLQRFTPRGPRSLWSQVNRERVKQLITDKRVAPRGRREYQQAHEDGRLEAAYAPASTATVPDDLAAALAAVPAAKAFFEELDSRNRYAVLHRVQTAKLPETRARRIATFVEMLAAGEQLHPRRPKAR